AGLRSDPAAAPRSGLRRNGRPGAPWPPTQARRGPRSRGDPLRPGQARPGRRARIAAVARSDDLFSVRDRNVLITGAGRGIGRVLALAFADAGANVVAAGRTAKDLEATAAEVRERGRQALAVPTDVTSVASVDALVETTARELGRLDVLINNAGIFVNRPAVEMSEAEWTEMSDTNVKGVFFCARAAARVMIRQSEGRIVNVSSALARVAQEGYACYCANKAAVEQLTRVLALEWAPHGITVNAIAPTTTE